MSDTDLYKMPILYTDTINGKQTCRDDMWAVTTEQIKAISVDHDDLLFQNDCHSGTDVCECSQKNGYPCYRHIDFEYRRLFALNTETTVNLKLLEETVKLQHTAITTSEKRGHDKAEAGQATEYCDQHKEDHREGCPHCLFEKMDDGQSNITDKPEEVKEFRVRVEPTQPNFWVTDDDCIAFPFHGSDDAFDLVRLLNAKNTDKPDKLKAAFEILDNVLYWETVPQEYVDKILILQGRIKALTEIQEETDDE